ncbi:hypothetical protein [Aquibacillus albus]|uniref:Uncharacterized protein n=1 Tax=Aquibacillus albus TaxID=1168171 RepID=A0ABS2MZU3_9BACI|nr:hypothetical protein [Aquibacillus albus]MBM7571414.1 hypothetical protein [Aquibacillus albus]
MTNRNDFPYKKSYESDGVMGKDKKHNKNKIKKAEKRQDDSMFFNTTESSE